LAALDIWNHDSWVKMYNLYKVCLDYISHALVYERLVSFFEVHDYRGWLVYDLILLQSHLELKHNMATHISND
jgi:hypothetical protein